MTSGIMPINTDLLPPLPVADPGPLPPSDHAPRIPVIGSLPWDQPVTTYDDLARFLGGSGDSFTGDLLRLIQRSDPGNRSRLARVYPGEVLAWCIWIDVERSAAALGTDAAMPTAAALLGLMLLAHRGGALPGDPAGTVAAAAWSPGTTDGLAIR